MSSTTNTHAADATRESSPLHTVETAFAALCTAPQPLALFGAVIHPQLPARWIPLDELRKALITKKYDLSCATRCGESSLVALAPRARSGRSQRPGWQPRR